MAVEFKMKGANIFLGPGVNIARIPQNGRIFEYLSGEDPYLASALVIPTITALQNKKVAACIKHFTNNEQEYDRMVMSSDVDERSRFEIYYPPFLAAIEAGVVCVMCSYNKIHGKYSCENEETINELRNKLNFKGWILSDWLATHSSIQALKAGLNQELPLGLHFDRYILWFYSWLKLLPEYYINESVTKILTAMFTIGWMDADAEELDGGDPLADVTSPEHRNLARKIAAESTILLKNENGLLPLALDGSKLRSICVIGDTAPVVGGGSGHVDPPYIVTLFEGISNELLQSNNNIEVSYSTGEDMTQAMSLASTADVVVIVVGCSATEGSDRQTLSLGAFQNNLVEHIAAVNSAVVVAVRSPGAVLMPWEPLVRAVLLTFLPGQEAGSALSDVLFGKVNPSGRLPITIPHKDNEINMTTDQYPGIGIPKHASYSERLEVGYRWYNAHKVQPHFPFGYGLSYTSFLYTNMIIQYDHSYVRSSSTSILLQGSDQENEVIIIVNVDVSNSGGRKGADVIQLYMTYPDTSEEPPTQLKGFVKVNLDVNESQTVEFQVTARQLSIWDIDHHSWKIDTGEYVFTVGSSSTNIALKKSIKI